MTVAAIVQARLGSSRLPAKVLLPLPTGRTVLEEVICRCKMIKGVNVVVVAIPDTAENDIIEAFATRGLLNHENVENFSKFHVVRGPEHDVLSRYVKAAASVDADIVMRITADCPLIDVATCEALLDLFHYYDDTPFAFRLDAADKVDYASNCWPARHFPHGWDCEVFTREILMRAHMEIPSLRTTAKTSDGGLVGLDNPRGLDREHAGCPWMQKNGKTALLKSMEDRSHIRWTLDTLADYKVIWDEFARREREAA